MKRAAVVLALAVAPVALAKKPKPPACASADDCFELGEAYRVLSENPAASAPYAAACDKGHARACAQLALLYRYGDGDHPLDKAKAAQLYERACALKLGLGCAAHGYMMKPRGELGAGDKAKSEELVRRGFELDEKGCAAGDAEACGFLASWHTEGGPVKQDAAKGAELLGRACDGGVRRRCRELAAVLAAGRSVPRDEARAKELRATIERQETSECEGGSVRACFELYASRRGADGDPAVKRAFELMEKGCKGGDAALCLALGLRDEQNALDDAAAAKRVIAMYEKACDLGYGRGCVNLGDTYDAGELTRKDAKKARKLYERACDLGVKTGCEAAAEKKALDADTSACNKKDAAACARLAERYETGEGVAVDLAEMESYLRKACDLGDGSSCAHLGGLFEKGTRFIAKDKAKAAALYKKACAKDQQYCGMLEILCLDGKGIPECSPR